MKSDPKRWIHPQAVPRGFLRLYILSLLSRQPETGYSVMRTIAEKSDGAWRPGAGTVYPLLAGMAKDGLVKKLDSNGREARIAYSLTEKGRLELEEMQRTIASAGRREQAMMRFFVDVLPATAFATMVLRRGREMVDIFREKIAEVPQPERDAILKEMRVVFENQLSWINSVLVLKASTHKSRKRAE